MEKRFTFANSHVKLLKDTYAEMGRLEIGIASAKEWESNKFADFLREIKLGDRIHWIEIDDREYEGTAINYLNAGTPDFGVRVAIEYGNLDLTVNKATLVAKAWRVE